MSRPLLQALWLIKGTVPCSRRSLLCSSSNSSSKIPPLRHYRKRYFLDIPSIKDIFSMHVTADLLTQTWKLTCRFCLRSKWNANVDLLPRTGSNLFLVSWVSTIQGRYAEIEKTNDPKGDRGKAVSSLVSSKYFPKSALFVYSLARSARLRISSKAGCLAGSSHLLRRGLFVS